MKLFSKRLLTMLLAISMVFGFSGMTAFAAEAEDVETQDVSAEPKTLSGDTINDIKIYKNGYVIGTITVEDFEKAEASVDPTEMYYTSGSNQGNQTWVTARFVSLEQLLGQAYKPDSGCSVTMNSVSYFGYDLSDVYLYDNSENNGGIRTAVNGTRGMYWQNDVDSIVLGHDFDASGVCSICGTSAADSLSYNVKYAVCLWGIEQDEDRYGNKLGLTFGPATGADYTSTYQAHLTADEYDPDQEKYCLHWMTWDEIIAQSEEDPTVLEDCFENGCTHSVNITLNSTLLGTSYENRMDNGDGAGLLFNSVNSTYRNWNSASGDTGGWPASQIRATLNGKDRQTGSGAGNALDTSDCLLSCFPTALQDAIVPTAVTSDTVYNSESEKDTKITYDKLWLYSGKEVYGDSGSNNDVIRANEGTLSQRSEALQITTTNYEALTNYDETGTAGNWRLRSMEQNDSNYAYQVTTNGNWGRAAYNSTTAGFAPCFCLRGTENKIDERYYDVKYAVTIWGINHDVDEDGTLLGLTFGPATGADYRNDYVAHLDEDQYDPDNGVYCIHWMSWEEIAEQSKKDPTVFQECMRTGCTHAVNLTLNSTLLDGSYADEMDDGDGVGGLYNSITNSYRRWNNSNDTTGGWPASQIRAVLNGEDELIGNNAPYAVDEEESLFSCFPETLQKLIVPKAVSSSTVAGSEEKEDIVITNDKLWLFAPVEGWGYAGTSRDSSLNPAEGMLYERSALWDVTTTLDDAQYRLVSYDEEGQAEHWFLRSLYNNSQVYSAYNSRAYLTNANAGSSYACAPGFCLAGTGEKKGDMSALQAEYDEDILLNGEDYTEYTWTPFKEALDAAERLLKYGSATQEKIDEILSELVTTREALQIMYPDISLYRNGELVATVTGEMFESLWNEVSEQTFTYTSETGETVSVEARFVPLASVCGDNQPDRGCGVSVLTDDSGGDGSIFLEPDTLYIYYDLENHCYRTAVNGAGESSWLSGVTGMILGHELVDGVCDLCGAEEPDTLHYAVKIWGIESDTYSTDGGKTTKEAGLTFGPATGDNASGDATGYLYSYQAHLTEEQCDPDKGAYCIHWMTWEEIIEQSKEDPTVFQDCLDNGCTKAVEITPNDTIFNETTINNAFEKIYYGDGMSTLYYVLNRSNPVQATRWNFSTTGYTADDPANIYSKSRIRVTLNGDASDAELKYASYYGEDGDGSDLCNADNCLFSCFPEELQSAIVPRTTVNAGTPSRGTSANDKTTYDRLFLFSLSETGISENDADDDGKNYGVNGNAASRYAYEFSGTSAAAVSVQAWWTRTRQASTDNNVFSVYSNGGMLSGSPISSTEGLSPGFCLAGPGSDEPTEDYITIVVDGEESELSYEAIDEAIADVPDQILHYTSDGNEYDVTAQFVRLSDLIEIGEDFCSFTVTAGNGTTVDELPKNTYLYKTEEGEYRTAVSGSDGKLWIYDPVTIVVVTQHSWSEVEWTWSEDYSSAEASRTCEVCGETETAKATITIETTDPTATEDGLIVYTATATFEDGTVVTDTRTESIPASAEPTVSVTVTSTLTDNTKTYDSAGVSLTATAVVTPDTAEVASYQWYTVAEDGTETAIEGATTNLLNLEGNVSDSGTYKCVVTATNDGLTAEGIAEITITIEKAAQDISYETIAIEKTVGDDAFTNPLTETTVSTDADAGITYTSSNETVATVDANGEVTILAAGETTITATAAETANFEEAAASYTLTVSESTNEPGGTVDKEPLEKEVEEVEKEISGLNKDNYTEDSWAALEKALADAQAVVSDATATQDEVNAALKDLESAWAGLEKKPKDTGGDTKNGLYKIKSGEWGYYKNDEVDTSYTGFASNQYGDWYVVNGYIHFDQNTVAKDKTGKDGDKGVASKGDWWYVVGSEVQHDFTGLANYKNANGWWYIKNGKVDFTHTGVDKNKNGWWYVKDGKVEFGHNGVDKNQYGWWYITGGKVQFGFTGLANYKNSNGWWYIKDGKVDFSHNGVDKNKNGWWYVRGGKVDFGYTGRASNTYGTWNIVSGKVVF